MCVCVFVCVCVCVCVCVWAVLHTCEESVVVQASFLVLMWAHIEQVGLDGPVDEVCGEVEQHDAEHHHHYGPNTLQRPFGDKRCNRTTRLITHRAHDFYRSFSFSLNLWGVSFATSICHLTRNGKGDKRRFTKKTNYVGQVTIIS